MQYLVYILAKVKLFW